MSKADDLLKERLASMIESLETSVTDYGFIISEAKGARDTLKSLDAAQEDIAHFEAIAAWGEFNLKSVQSLLDSARKIQDGDTSDG